MTRQTAVPPRALAFVWGGIGNMVMALPMLAALRNNAALCVVAQKSAMLDLVDDGAFDRPLALDADEYRGIAGKVRLARELRERRADFAISSVPAPRRFAALALLAGARRVGEVPATDGARHIVHRNLAQLGRVGTVQGGPDYSLLHRGDAAPALRSLGIAEGEDIVGIFMGAGHPLRRWPGDRVEVVAHALAEQYRVVVLADPGDTEAGRMTGRVSMFGGPLRQKLGLLAACRLFIGANTGLTHCAAALGVPTLELAGPTDPAVYGALGRRVAVVRGGAACAPCYRSGNRYGCRRRPAPCMESITVGRVLAAAESLLSDRP
ncbi:MAG: glycosyltransferase family 9 protein [Candidatus Edwardsbacteria bacterium]|nr:glycosyltransferase family 9 protein [Candidatus Edwardsbacteria bacterium]